MQQRCRRLTKKSRGGRISGTGTIDDPKGPYANAYKGCKGVKNTQYFYTNKGKKYQSVTGKKYNFIGPYSQDDSTPTPSHDSSSAEEGAEDTEDT